MSPELISQLSEIKWLLICILVLVIILLLAFIAFFWIVIPVNKARGEQLLRENFVSNAQTLEDQGKYDEMIKICKDRLQEFPVDTTARYYLSIAHERNGEPGLALNALARLKEINPIWEKAHIDEMIENIKSSMKGPST